MEYLFGDIKKLEVVSVTDGKNLGKAYDLSFSFPENKIKGFYVTGCKGFKFTKSEIFIPVCDIVKIGEDTLLVKFGEKPKPPKKDDCEPKPPCPPRPCDPRRNFDEYE